MIATTKFFIWFFMGLWGLGGWVIFFFLSAAAVIYVYLDSSQRRLPAMGWRLAITLVALLLLPTVIFRFVPVDVQASLDQFIEYIFYLGLIGGVIPFFIALGFFLYFRGMVACENGHVYEAMLGECPDCPSPLPPPLPDIKDRPEHVDPRFTKPKVAAFLISSKGMNFQLNKGRTTIGRSSENDISLPNGKVSKRHAKIEEEDGHFWLYDLGSTNGTWLNSERVNARQLLESDDVIQFGEEIELKFIMGS